MSQKTKNIIEETSDTIDPKGLAVLSYRVSQLETASKEAATAQREGVDMLSTKIDRLAHNFVTEATLIAAQREATLQHQIIKEEIRSSNTSHNGRLHKLESWNTWATRLVLGTIILAILALVVANNVGSSHLLPGAL